MRTATDWQAQADDYDRRADVKRTETDEIEGWIKDRLAFAEVDPHVVDEVMRLVSRHGLTARDWGANRAHADDLAVRALDARAQESSHAHIDRHLHITASAA